MNSWARPHVWPLKEGDDANYRNAIAPNIFNFFQTFYVASDDFNTCPTIRLGYGLGIKACKSTLPG